MYKNNNNLATLCLLLGILLLTAACSGGGGGGGGSDPDPDPNPEPPCCVVEPPTGTGALPDRAEHDNAFESAHYAGSAECTVCHDHISDEADNDVSIGRDWSASMMANSTRDPYWIAKVASEINKHPHLKDVLNDTCSTCHAPMANDEAKKSGKTFEILGENGLISASNEYFNHTMEGVSCTFCHQMADNGLMGTIDGVSGKFFVEQYENEDDRPAYGQYADPNGAYMVAVSNFNPQYGSHISTSESCAVCHDLRTPSLDEEGQLITDVEEDFFPEQMVYSEWLHSDYATGGTKEKTCQNCHMPKAEGEVLLATEGGGDPRTGFSKHTFLGANTVMQTILKNYREELGISVEPELFDRSIALNREFLRTAADLQIVATSLEGNKLTTSIQITNQTGHKLPSGYPSRRVFVHFVVTNAQSEVVFESGKVNSDGSIVGVATDKDTSQYESHYNVITAADQVQVYEAIMGTSDGDVTHTLLRANRYLKDNRLLPSGFDKETASKDIAVAGGAIEDANFAHGADVVHYVIDVPASGTYTVAAELRYQPLAYGHLQDLFKSVALKEVDEFKTMFDATTMKTETISSDVTVVN